MRKAFRLAHRFAQNLTHYSLLITLELLQKPQVVPVEQPYIVYAVAQHRYALGAEAEGEAAEVVRVDPAVDQHLWVDHPRTHNLQPACVLARAAAFASADNAVNGQVDARLHVREVIAAEAHLALRSEEGAGQRRERALQVGQRDVLVHGQPLDL